MKILWIIFRKITILILITVGVGFLYVISEFLLAKIMPQNRIVSCWVLSSSQCQKRPDCHAITLGGVGYSGGPSTCFKR